MVARQSRIALRAAFITRSARQRTITSGFNTAHHTVDASASLAGPAWRCERRAVRHLRTLEYTTMATWMRVIAALALVAAFVITARR